MSEQSFEVQLKLWPIAWPIFVEFLLVFTVFFADTFFLSQISDEIAGAVGMLFPVFGLCAMMILMIGSAGTSVAAQFIGGKRFEKVIPTYMTLLGINLTIGSVLTTILWFSRNHLGTWMGFKPELNDQTSIYLGFVAFVWIILGHRSVYSTIFLSRGLSQWNMRTAILINISNISLNAVFVWGLGGIPKMGIVGIALSTLISGVLANLFVMWVAHVKLDIHFQWKGAYERCKGLIRPILRIGIPSTVEPASYQFSQVMINLMVVGLGELSMNTKTFTFNILILGISWSIGLGIASQVIVAHHVGAQKFDEASQRFNHSLKLTVLGSFGIALLTFLFARPLLSLFTDNPEVYELGVTLLIFSFILEPVRSVSIISSSSLKGAGDTKFTSYIGATSFVFILIPLSYVLGIHWGYGLVGVWTAYVVDEVFRMSVNYSRWRHGKWKDLGVLGKTSD